MRNHSDVEEIVRLGCDVLLHVLYDVPAHRERLKEAKQVSRGGGHGERGSHTHRYIDISRSLPFSPSVSRLAPVLSCPALPCLALPGPVVSCQLNTDGSAHPTGTFEAIADAWCFTAIAGAPATNAAAAAGGGGGGGANTM